MKTISLTSFALASLLLSVSVQAQNLYLSAAVTRTDNFATAYSAPNRSYIGDNYPTGYKVAVGYEVYDWTGMEFGWADLGEAIRDYTVSGAPSQQRTRARATYLAVKESVPLGEHFSLFGQLGLAWNGYSADDAPVPSHNGKYQRQNRYFGGGLAYHLNKRFAITVEYEDFGQNAFDQNLRTVSAGARLTF